MTRNCGECGRYLPSLESQRRGVGPKCRRKRRQMLAKSFKAQQVDRARAALRSGSVSRLRSLKGGNGVYRVRSGENTYLATRDTCTCKSNRYRLTAGNCWHTLSVGMRET